MNYALLLAILLMLSGTALAHTVTFNLVMNIDGKNNTIHVNGTDYNTSTPAFLTFINVDKSYVAANNTTSMAAIVSAGTLLNMRINTTYNSTHYLLQMTQDSERNRLLIVMTNGTYVDIEDKLSMIDTIRMISSTFGRFVVQTPSSFNTFIRLEYTNIDITGAAEWSGIGQLLIRNRGLTGRSIPNITLEVTR